MPHPLFSLLSQRHESTPKSTPSASEPTVAACASVAAKPPQKSRGDAEGVDGAGRAEVADDPWQVAPGVAILAILDPAGPDGTPGRMQFVPGLTLAERREILRDVEWFDVRVRRRLRLLPDADADDDDTPPTERSQSLGAKALNIAVQIAERAASIRRFNEAQKALVGCRNRDDEDSPGIRVIETTQDSIRYRG